MAARLAERMHRLWDWTHPWKTRLMLTGMLCGTLACLLIPNNYLVAMALAQKFQSGAAKKWPAMFGKKKKAEKIKSSNLNLDGDTIQVGGICLNGSTRHLLFYQLNCIPHTLPACR